MIKIKNVKGSTNEVVTSYYIDIIYQACLKKGLDIEYFNNNKEIQKKDILVLSTITEALKYWFLGYKNFIIWIQGVLPEESYLKHSSKFRYLLLSEIEKFILRKSRFIFFVSNEMKTHYESKYKLNLGNKYFVMPCFNTDINISSFNNHDRYRCKTFTYVGSLSKWQCFEEVLDLYKKIESVINDCSLNIYTSSIQEANTLAKKKGLKNFSVEFLNSSELIEKLSKTSFGFVLRENNTVNYVATPTKLSNYLACGVIPIFSTSLRSFTNETNGLEYFLPINNKDDIEKIVNFCNKEVDLNRLRYEYEYIFNSYYSKNKYINEIGIKLEKNLGNKNNDL